MDSFFKYFWEKLSASVLITLATFTQDQTTLMLFIIYIVILDTMLGIWVALRYRIFSSHHLSRVFNKIGCYGLAMASVWTIAAVEPIYFGWVYRAVGVFIIVTEIFSNFEKLALLGFEIPGRILAKLNRQFYYFIGLDDCEKDEVAIDILKNRRSL
jgi:hypothetical protein